MIHFYNDNLIKYLKQPEIFVNFSMKQEHEPYSCVSTTVLHMSKINTKGTCCTLTLTLWKKKL